MMNKLLMVALTVTLLSGCQSDDGSAGTDNAVVGGKPIVVAATVGGTRSFATDDRLWVWADKTATDDFIKAWALDYNGTSFRPTTSYYWPENVTGLTFKAVYGNFPTNAIMQSATTWTGLELTHTVESNQTSAASRQKSDLLYKQTAATKGEVVDLKLEHQLSMVSVVLEKVEGSGISDDVLRNATVRLSGAVRTTTFKCSDLSTTPSGSAETIEMGGSDNKREAIIPCQEATLTLEVTLNNFPASSMSRTFTCTLPTTSFHKGQNYQYTLTLNNNVSATLSSISQWSDETVGIVIPPATVAGD